MVNIVPTDALMVFTPRVSVGMLLVVYEIQNKIQNLINLVLTNKEIISWPYFAEAHFGVLFMSYFTCKDLMLLISHCEGGLPQPTLIQGTCAES